MPPQPQMIASVIARGPRTFTRHPAIARNEENLIYELGTKTFRDKKPKQAYSSHNKTNGCTDTNIDQCNEIFQGNHHQQEYRLDKNNGCIDTNIYQCNEPLQGTHHQ